MQLFIKSILAVIFTLSFLSTTISKIGDLYSKDSPYLVQKISIEETLLKSMSVEEKVGQLFMFGFYGTTPTEHITKYITDKHIGGILLLGYNIENSVQLENLITQLQSSSSIPLLISIDQEGGIVSRLTWNDILTLPQKNISSGQQGYDIAYQRGLQLKEIGINMNLAPVVEYINNGNSFLYQRVFRGTKQDVVEKGSSMIKGYTDSNIVSTLKHYPGHNDSSPDSHYNMPIVDTTTSQWEEYIYTFKEITEKENVPAIMIGHISLPNIDGKPSTISNEILNNRLRKELGYDGVIITDDMEMGSIEKVGEYTTVSKEALIAGNDILLYSGDSEVQTEVYEYILGEVANGGISEKLLDEKVLRILKLKIDYGIIPF